MNIIMHAGDARVFCKKALDLLAEGKPAEAEEEIKSRLPGSGSSGTPALPETQAAEDIGPCGPLFIRLFVIYT